VVATLGFSCQTNRAFSIGVLDLGLNESLDKGGGVIMFLGTVISVISKVGR